MRAVPILTLAVSPLPIRRRPIRLFAELVAEPCKHILVDVFGQSVALEEARYVFELRRCGARVGVLGRRVRALAISV